MLNKNSLNVIDNGYGLLSKNQLFGNNKLKTIEKYGTKCAMTDFAILLGGYVSNKHMKSKKDYSDRTGDYYTSSFHGIDSNYVVSEKGILAYNYSSDSNSSVRPIFTDLSKLDSINDDTVLYGEYPQNAVNPKLGRLLSKLYNNGSLKETGKTYTAYYKNLLNTKAKNIKEYEYNGKKYVRVKANTNSFFTVLSNNTLCVKYDYVWIEAEKIKWYFDKETKTLISEKLLFSGVKFNKLGKNDGKIENTEIFKILNDTFSKDIIPSSIFNREYQYIWVPNVKKVSYNKVKLES